MHFIGPKRIADDVRRVRYQCIAVHGYPSSGTDKASATFTADGFAGIRLAVKDYSAGVFVTRAAVFHENLDRTGIVGVGSPLDDVVVVLAPIEFTDIEPVRARNPVVGQPRGRAEIQIPIKAHRDWLGGAETLRPEDAATIAVGVNGLQLADPAAADKFTSFSKFALVLAALLGAGLVHSAIAQHGVPDSLTLADRASSWFFTINILAGCSGHGRHGGMPVRGRGD